MSTPDDFKEVTAAIREMSSKLDRMLDGKIREARAKLGPQTPVRLRNTVFIAAHDAAGVSLYSAATSSNDPPRDAARAMAAIELVGAIEREGRNITPDALYTMLVGRKYMPPPAIDPDKEHAADLAAVAAGTMSDDERINRLINRVATAASDKLAGLFQRINGETPDPLSELLDRRNRDYGAGRCATVQHSDTTECRTCGQLWDTNDSNPPPCPRSDR